MRIDRNAGKMDRHFSLHFVRRQLISKLTRENVCFHFVHTFHTKKEHEHIKCNGSVCDAAAAVDSAAL